MATRWATRPAVEIPVNVGAGACGDEVIGWVNGVLELKVTALPDGGRANAAVERLLAEIVRVDRHRVRVVRGYASPHKIVEIEGLNEEDLEHYLPGRQAEEPAGSE